MLTLHRRMLTLVLTAYVSAAFEVGERFSRSVEGFVRRLHRLDDAK